MIVALCCIARLENDYIQEWVDHHRRVGISKFFVYCNAREGEPKVEDVLSGQDDVIIIRKPGHAQQIPAYNQFINKDITPDVEWAGFLDCDEFVVPVKHKNVPDLLREFGDKNNGTLALQWRMFDSNGHVTKPVGKGVRESYTRSWFYPCVKTFLNRRAISQVKAVRHVHTIAGDVSAISGFKLGPMHTERPPKERNKCRDEKLCDIAFIAHYVCKSEEEYFKKCSRGCADGNTPYNFYKTRDKWCRAPEARRDARVLEFV